MRIPPVDIRLRERDSIISQPETAKRRRLPTLRQHSRTGTHSTGTSDRQVHGIVTSSSASASYPELPGIGDRGLQQLPKEIDIVFIVGFPQKAAHRFL